MELTSVAPPRHVAIVMDGNGRWASKRFLPRIAGHRQGMEALRKVVAACLERGVQVLTVFAFSSENWKRPPEEVDGLLSLLTYALAKEVPLLDKQGVRLCMVGATQHLSPRVQDAFTEAEKVTAANTHMVLNVCFNYGGRWDVVQAARSLADAGQPITEDTLSQSLATARCGDPDLFIRTGGEMRLSNFLLWQAAYSELYFCDVLWPDFDTAALDAAFAAYASRERRFGKTSAQLAHASSTAA